MDRDNEADELHIVDLLMDNDPETIEWLRKLGLVEVDAEGGWHATALARSAVHRSREQLLDLETPLRSSLLH
jgi:hypothetical protein